MQPRRSTNPAKVVVTDSMPRRGLLPRTPGEQALLDAAPERAQDHKVGSWRYPRLLDKENRRRYRHARLAYRRGDAATGLPIVLRLNEAEPWYMQGRIMLDLLIGVSANTDAERTLATGVALNEETLAMNERLRQGQTSPDEIPRFYGGDRLTPPDHDYIEFAARYNLAETLAELGELTDSPASWRKGLDQAAAAASVPLLDRNGRPDALLLASARLIHASLAYRLGEDGLRAASLATARALVPNDIAVLVQQMSSKNPGLQ